MSLQLAFQVSKADMKGNVYSNTGCRRIVSGGQFKIRAFVSCQFIWLQLNIAPRLRSGGPNCSREASFGKHHPGQKLQ